MKCGQLRRLIDPYLENELNSRERSVIVHHLKKCESCRMHFDLASALTLETRNLRIPDSEPDWESVSRRVEARRESIIIKAFTRFSENFESKIFKTMIPAFSAAAAVVIFAFAIFALNYIVTSSQISLTEHDLFVLSEIKAAERVCEADLMSIKNMIHEDLVEINPEIQKVLNDENRLAENRIIKCRELLRADPYDTEARETLFASYRKQAKLYNDFHKLNHKEVSNEI